MPLVDYAGAGSLLTPDRGLQLGRGWAWQPKVDGAYCRASTDRRGRILSILGRNGRQIQSSLAGIPTGVPDAVLHGEIEAHTEAGIRAAATRGWACLHLFDVSRIGGRRVADRPYAERYGALHASQAAAECEGGRSDWWTVDDQGDAHGPDGRYVSPVPADLRRCPVVPMVRTASQAEQLWRDYVELQGGEGLVAVNLTAPLGRRGAKRKIKTVDPLDCRIVALQGSYATLEYRGHLFAVSARGQAIQGLAAGAIVEVAHNGWYEAGVTPRFARIVRARPDR